MSKIITVALLGFFLSSCGYANIDEVKSISPDKWEKQGFKVVDYEGFTWGWWVGGSYGGARVWYRLNKIPDNGITYSGYISKWGDEYHVYGPYAADAIRP